MVWLDDEEGGVVGSGGLVVAWRGWCVRRRESALSRHARDAMRERERESAMRRSMRQTEDGPTQASQRHACPLALL